MNLPDVPLLSMLKDRMRWLEARQQVLSQNVANADTPNYSARDLKPLDFESLLGKTKSLAQGGLTLTDPRHIAITPASSDFQAQETGDFESNPNGNSVSLEQEMIKISDTQAQFQAATNLYAKTMQLMRTALGKSS